MRDLWARLGGEAAVEASVVRFYRKVKADPDLSPFFEGFDLRDQMEKHITFMVTALGGPVAANRRGPDLGQVHAPLVRRGLSAKHVDGFVRIMREVLGELDVAEADIEEVVARLENARPTVLGSDVTRGGGGGGGGGRTGGGESPPGSGSFVTGVFDQVVVTDGPRTHAYSPAEFLALPLGLRVTVVVENRAKFFCENRPVDADTALAAARKRRAHAP